MKQTIFVLVLLKRQKVSDLERIFVILSNPYISFIKIINLYSNANFCFNDSGSKSLDKGGFHRSKGL